METAFGIINLCHINEETSRCVLVEHRKCIKYLQSARCIHGEVYTILVTEI